MTLASNHFTDSNGNPAGGTTYGRGFAIGWQNGPLVDDGERISANGAFVEDIIKAAIDRIQHYQSTRFKSGYNENALLALNRALDHLAGRTKDREARGVEGTHQS